MVDGGGGNGSPSGGVWLTAWLLKALSSWWVSGVAWAANASSVDCGTCSDGYMLNAAAAVLDALVESAASLW